MHEHFIDELRRIVGPYGVIDDPHALMTYNADGCMMDTHEPDVVVVPTTTEQIVAVVKLAKKAGIPVIARGAGTGLSGGATPIKGGVVISLSRMEEILDVDPPNGRAVIQPGIINFELSEQIKSYGYHFAPDPSSQKTCTVGGNIANNSGGPHCLKYGVTSNHILALEIVLHDGTLLWTGDGFPDAAGYDLTGLIVGSEGTFCLITRALVRLTRLPEANRVVLALFPTIASATEVVSEVVAAGYLPTSLEMMDNYIIRAVNKGYKLGLPETAGAALIVEVDGVEDGLDDLLQEIIGICREHGAVEIRPAKTAAEQVQVWAARKNAFGAVGRLAPSYYLADTVVPRTRLPYMMEQVARLSKEYELDIANVFHAGDGNLHPIVLFDARDESQVERAVKITSEVITLSIEQGGAISGEHGIGIEKRAYMVKYFTDADLQTMAAVYAVFNPDGSLNPSKVFPPDVNPLEVAQQRQARIASTQGTRSLNELGGLLQASVGDDAILTGDAVSPYTVQNQRPDYVVLPTDVEQLSQVMATCHQTGSTVVPWGGGTQQNTGSISTRPDVVVVTRRLTAIEKYEPNDLTIGVGAGMTLSELQALLAQHNQMFPIDAPMPDMLTLGGLVATAADGPRRAGYGIVRDALLGMTVVEVDGTIIKLGGQVVKNVSGYDLVKLFLGGFGTTGIIASVNLKTFPRPRTERTFATTFIRSTDALHMLADLSASLLTPTAVEYLSQGALQRLGIVGACGLAIRAEGLDVACTRHMKDLHTLATRHNSLEVYEIEGDDQLAFWSQVQSLSALNTIDTDEAIIRLLVRPSDFGSALTYLEERAIAHGFLPAIQARALNGVLYMRVKGSLANLAAFQHDLVERWRHSHVLACPPGVKAELPLWGKPPVGIEIMQALKRAFDPADKLNPGRYLTF